MAGSIHISFVAVASVWAVGCTQVHQLGQVGGSAGSATSSFSSEDSETDLSSETNGDDEIIDETDDEGSDETGGPIPDACDVVDLGGEQGVTLEIVLMSEWNAGACHEFYLTNETADDVIWTRDLRFGGTLENYWNAEGEQLSATDWRFGGQASAGNIVVLSGETVDFGGCMVCMP